MVYNYLIQRFDAISKVSIGILMSRIRTVWCNYITFVASSKNKCSYDQWESQDWKQSGVKFLIGFPYRILLALDECSEHPNWGW